MINFVNAKTPYGTTTNDGWSETGNWHKSKIRQDLSGYARGVSKQPPDVDTVIGVTPFEISCLKAI